MASRVIRPDASHRKTVAVLTLISLPTSAQLKRTMVFLLVIFACEKYSREMDGSIESCEQLEDIDITVNKFTGVCIASMNTGVY
jgi:hypothetical protein